MRSKLGSSSLDQAPCITHRLGSDRLLRRQAAAVTRGSRAGDGGGEGADLPSLRGLCTALFRLMLDRGRGLSHLHSENWSCTIAFTCDVVIGERGHSELELRPGSRDAASEHGSACLAADA